MFLSIAHATELATEHGAEVAQEGLLASLGINSTLFIFQLVNFALVALILWFLILKPLTKKMAERQKMIDDSVDNAKKIETNLNMSEKKYQEKIDQAKVDANKIIASAQQEAVAAAEMTKEKSKKELEKLVEEARKNIKAERDESVAEIKQQVGNLIIAAAEKVLAGKISAEKDSEIIDEAIKDLK